MNELVHESLERHARNTPEHLALVVGERRWTYAGLFQRCRETALVFQERGVERGDRVAICLENGFEYVVSLYATLMAGAAVVPLSVRLPRGKLDGILRDCAPRLLVTEPRLGIPRNRAVEHCILVGDETRTECGDGVSRYADLRCSGEGPAVAVAADDLCYVIYTSGSKGTPKGVMMEHAAVAFAADSIIQYLGNDARDVVFDALPLSFDYGLYNLLMPLRFGGTVVLESSDSHPYSWLARLRHEGVTGLPLLPSILAMLLRLRPDQFVVPTLRYATTTGQHLPVEDARRFTERHPAVRFFSMYGLSECKRATYLPPERLLDKPGSVGIPIPGTRAYPVDSRGRRITRPGEVGELIVEGPHVMRGYWNDPDTTRSVLKSADDVDTRRLHTGDLFRVDEEGFLYFQERRDGLVKVGGVRVSPCEVERVLSSMGEVREVAVFGVPHAVLGTVLHAVVVPSLQSGLTVSALRSFAEQSLEPACVPRTFELLEQLPMTLNGKTDHRRLESEWTA